MEEEGWNVQGSLPIRLWSDVISVTANCAHNLFSTKRHSWRNAGLCEANYTLLSQRTGQRKHRQAPVLQFQVRESGNRGD